MNAAWEWCRQRLGTWSPLDVGDVVVSSVVVLLAVYWIQLLADMLADSYVVASGGAYAISGLTFLAVGAFVMAPLGPRRIRSVFWLGSKLFILVTSLALGVYCSLFHRTTFFFFQAGTEMKGHLSFVDVFSLRRDAEWMASNDLTCGERYYERVAYMAVLLLFTAVEGTLLVLRFRRARKQQ